MLSSRQIQCSEVKYIFISGIVSILINESVFIQFVVDISAGTYYRG